MTRLYLYTCFHANLAFSSIPSKHYSKIIDRCFWPIVDLLDKYPNIKLGFEFPSDTLITIHKEDPLLIDTLKKYWHSNRCEIIGSGYCQTIFPLIPASVNSRNLEIGNMDYAYIFNRKPVTAYVNEQTYSSGILQLYRDNGYKNIIVDWDNIPPSKVQDNSSKYRAEWIIGMDGTKMAAVWNSTISFQKFQRYYQGELNLDEYMAYLLSHHSQEEDRAFLLYGSDWEIFDYRPGDPDLSYNINSRLEMKRIESLFKSLSADNRFELITPSDVVRRLPPKNEIRLESADHPVPCKKQEKYNVTRWAVSGRENVRINTQCYQLYRNIKHLESLAKLNDYEKTKNEIEEMWKDLVYLWGSDFRTYTTDEKYIAFRNKMGTALNKSQSAINMLTKQIKVDKDFVLYNSSEYDWDGTSFAIEASFQPGEIRNGFHVLLDGEKVQTQIENAEYYKDNSLRKAILVIKPFVKSHAYTQGEISISPDMVPASSNALIENHHVRTDSVDVTFSDFRGGAIKGLSFPKIFDSELVGTLAHGYFRDIRMAADFYSAGLIAIDKTSNKKIADLNKTKILYPENLVEYPIRIPVKCRIDTQMGEIWKTFYIYRDEPRLDVQYHIRFKDFKPLSLRLGILTVKPMAFNKNSLKYSTVNGGYTDEIFRLQGEKVLQDEPVSWSVSAHHCLGASEGWIDISDNEKGVALIANKAEIYSVPLLHYEEIDDTYFLRIYTSIGESDDTSDVLWRGHNKITVTYLGHQGDVNRVKGEIDHINQNLLVVWKDEL